MLNFFIQINNFVYKTNSQIQSQKNIRVLGNIKFLYDVKTGKLNEDSDCFFDEIMIKRVEDYINEKIYHYNEYLIKYIGWSKFYICKDINHKNNILNNNKSLQQNQERLLDINYILIQDHSLENKQFIIICTENEFKQFIINNDIIIEYYKDTYYDNNMGVFLMKNNNIKYYIHTDFSFFFDILSVLNISKEYTNIDKIKIANNITVETCKVINKNKVIIKCKSENNNIFPNMKFLFNDFEFIGNIDKVNIIDNNCFELELTLKINFNNKKFEFHLNDEILLYIINNNNFQEIKYKSQQQSIWNNYDLTDSKNNSHGNNYYEKSFYPIIPLCNQCFSNVEFESYNIKKLKSEIINNHDLLIQKLENLITKYKKILPLFCEKHKNQKLIDYFNEKKIFYKEHKQDSKLNNILTIKELFDFFDIPVNCDKQIIDTKILFYEQMNYCNHISYIHCTKINHCDHIINIQCDKPPAVGSQFVIFSILNIPIAYGIVTSIKKYNGIIGKIFITRGYPITFIKTTLKYLNIIHRDIYSIFDNTYEITISFIDFIRDDILIQKNYISPEHEIIFYEE